MSDSKLLSRRRLLHSAGLSLALPLLPSLQELPFLQPVYSAETGPGASSMANPKRFCCIFFPNGVSLPPADHADYEQWHWFPHAVGANYSLTRSLEPLAPYRDQLSILSGLSHPAMRNTIAHVTADSFLTGADSSRIYTNSISIDQLIAAHIGSQTRFPSLTMSSDGGVGTPGRTQTLSFTASGKPIPSLSDPRTIFNRLFGIETRSLEQQRLQFGRDRSIFDNLLAETAAIDQQLSAADHNRLEEYTTSVREIEQRLERADQWLDAQRPQVEADEFELSVTPHDDAEDYIRAILDLIYVALLTDSTRSITYQITSEDAKGIGDRFPRSIGLSGHHALSHGTAAAKGYENWARYDQFLARQFAYLLERLNSTADPFQAGSLLDNTILFYGGSTSRTHQAVNYPLLLAGGGQLGLKHGQHRRFEEAQYRLSDLYVTLLQQLGVEVDRFADSTRSVSELLA